MEMDGDAVAYVAKRRLVGCGAAGEDWSWRCTEIEGRLGNVVEVEAQGRAGWVSGVSGHS